MQGGRRKSCRDYYSSDQQKGLLVGQLEANISFLLDTCYMYIFVNIKPQQTPCSPISPAFLKSNMTITKVAAIDLAVVLLQRVPATSRELLSFLLLLSQAHRTCLLLCWAQFRSHTTLQRGEPYKYGSLMLKAFNQVPVALILTSPPPSPVCRAPTKSCLCSFSCVFLTGESISS